VLLSLGTPGQQGVHGAVALVVGLLRHGEDRVPLALDPSCIDGGSCVHSAVGCAHGGTRVGRQLPRRLIAGTRHAVSVWRCYGGVGRDEPGALRWPRRLLGS
jgi:hypothetical protein